MNQNQIAYIHIQYPINLYNIPLFQLYPIIQKKFPVKILERDFTINDKLTEDSLELKVDRILATSRVKRKSIKKNPKKAKINKKFHIKLSLTRDDNIIGNQ